MLVWVSDLLHGEEVRSQRPPKVVSLSPSLVLYTSADFVELFCSIKFLVNDEVFELFVFFRSCPLFLSPKYFKIVLTFFFFLSLSVFLESNLFLPFFSDFLVSDGGSSFLNFTAELLGGGPLDECGMHGRGDDDDDGDELPDEWYDDDGDGLPGEVHDCGILGWCRVEGGGGTDIDEFGGGHVLLVEEDDDVDRSLLDVG